MFLSADLRGVQAHQSHNIGRHSFKSVPHLEINLTSTIREALNELIIQLANEAGVCRSDILEVVVVGNPIMHHLLLGRDAVPPGRARFALATTGAVEARAPFLGIDCRDITRVYVLPCIAGHVGADTAGAILSERPDQSSDCQLLVDIGTNAEIVLGNSEHLLSASSPTGPAFEGAQITTYRHDSHQGTTHLECSDGKLRFTTKSPILELETTNERTHRIGHSRRR